jgi:hypothetical protein
MSIDPLAEPFYEGNDAVGMFSEASRWATMPIPFCHCFADRIMNTQVTCVQKVVRSGAEYIQILADIGTAAAALIFQKACAEAGR